MNLVCVICSELLVPSDDIFHTPCGHIFHFVCLTKWLERSRTCPHCRERTTEHKIHRIYFNFSNNDTIVEDSTSLQEKIDNLIFQVKLKSNEIKNLREDKEKLQTQTSGLRLEVRNIESEINSKNSAIHALKEQIKYYKQQCADGESDKKEIARLKKKIEDLRNLQILIDASINEVDEIIGKTSDPATLTTYIAVMKREMTISFDKRRELRNKVKSLQQELTQVSMERNFLSEEYTKRKDLEEKLIMCESEKISLQNKLYNMEQTMSTVMASCIHVSNKAIFTEECDNSKVDKQFNSKEGSNTATKECVAKLGQSSKVDKDVSCIIIDSSSEENTPKNIKSQGFFSTKVNVVKRDNNNLKVPSILAKKSRFNNPNYKIMNGDKTFDGFGGHARYDKFPDPVQVSRVKREKEEIKAKKQKLDIGDNQKFYDLLPL